MARKTAATKPASDSPSPHDPTLDDVIVALQKSFSRVSEASRDVPPEQARALVTGNVGFEISARFDITNKADGSSDDRPDVLVHRQSGAIELKLTGHVETDARIRDASESQP